MVLRLVYHRASIDLPVRIRHPHTSTLLSLHTAPTPYLTDLQSASFVPETKGKELEDLDEIFNIPTGTFAGYHWNRAVYVLKRYLFRKKKLSPPTELTPPATELIAMTTAREWGRSPLARHPTGG